VRTAWLLLPLAACSFLDTTSSSYEDRHPRPADPDAQVEAPAASGPTFDNRPACRAFVDHVNGLPCVPGHAALNPELVCANTLQDVPCDATAWWTCATERTLCTNGVLTRADVSACPGPCATD